MPPTIALAIAPPILGIIQAAKTAGMPTQYAALAALLLGLTAALIYQPSLESALTGITTGLAAAGLYSGSTHLYNSTQDTHAPNP